MRERRLSLETYWWSRQRAVTAQHSQFKREEMNLQTTKIVY
jgi:hypothetical protein